MTNAIQLFNYEDHDMRIIELDGEPRMVAKDVCDILGLNHITNALQGIDSEDLTVTVIQSGGQKREMKLVNEAGFYDLVLKSRKPQARAFKRWVTHEVIPTIRKTGGYGQSSGVNEQQLDVLMRGIGMLEQSFGMMAQALERFAEQNKRFEPKPRRRIKLAEREEIFALHAEGIGSTHIGDALDISPGTVSSILSRARLAGELV